MNLYTIGWNFGTIINARLRCSNSCSQRSSPEPLEINLCVPQLMQIDCSLATGRSWGRRCGRCRTPTNGCGWDAELAGGTRGTPKGREARRWAWPHCPGLSGLAHCADGGALPVSLSVCVPLCVNERGEPAASHRWAGWSSRLGSGNLPTIFGGICSLHV